MLVLKQNGAVCDQSLTVPDKGYNQECHGNKIRESGSVKTRKEELNTYNVVLTMEKPKDSNL